MVKWGTNLYIYTELKLGKMINLIGTYECKADSKGRVMMPSSLKKQLNSIIHEGFIIKRSTWKKNWNRVLAGDPAERYQKDSFL